MNCCSFHLINSNFFVVLQRNRIIKHEIKKLQKKTTKKVKKTEKKQK